MASEDADLSSVANILSEAQAHQRTCPAFLSKLWLLVADKSTNDFIHWSDEGNSFIVQDQVAFAKYLLPQFFKHSNMASFIRQLNMYGFRKKSHLDEGALMTERTDIEFQHPHFVKGEIGQLELIKRKVSTKDDSKGKGNDVSKILSDVREVKGKQDHISAKLETMKSENTALWREVVTLRQRHEKQQKIVNRLIHFLITLVQPKVGGTNKRRQGSQLMIQGFPDGPSPSKPKYARTLQGAATIDEIANIGFKQGGNLDYLLTGDKIPGLAGSAAPEPKVTELFGEENLLAQQSAPDIPAAAYDTNIPVPAEGVDFGIGAPIQPQTSDPVASDFSNISVPAEVSAEGSFLVEAPAEDIAVTTALSPNVTYPLTPGEEAAWVDMSEGEAPADVFGLDDEGVIGGGVDAANPTDILEGVEDFGEGQLVLSSPPNGDSGVSPPSATADGTASRAMVQRLLSHEEQKYRQDIGEQLNLVQSNLHDFQHILSSNPSLTLELSTLLGDFQGLYEESGPIAIPEPVLNVETTETEENGGNPSYTFKPSDLQVTGNELVTYKPSSSSFSLSSFMAEDEDSLLKSLDDDSAALGQQSEGQVTFEL